MAMETSYNCAKGEKVLCLYGPLLYEAKCIEISPENNRIDKYLIHYVGWNKKWDEWVPASHLLKYNEANLLKQKEMQQAVDQQPKTKKRTAPKPTTPAPSKRSKKNNTAAQEALPQQEADQDDLQGLTIWYYEWPALNQPGRAIVRPTIVTIIQCENQFLVRIRTKVLPAIPHGTQVLTESEATHLRAQCEAHRVLPGYFGISYDVKMILEGDERIAHFEVIDAELTP